MKDSYRLIILFPSGNSLTTTVNFDGLKRWIASEQFGYKIQYCNNYRWRSLNKGF